MLYVCTQAIPIYIYHLQVELDSLHNRAVEIAGRLVQRPEDTELRVKSEMKHYRENILRHLEDYIIQHSQQHVIELDANLPAQQLFRVCLYNIVHLITRVFILMIDC